MHVGQCQRSLKRITEAGKAEGGPTAKANQPQKACASLTYFDCSFDATDPTDKIEWHTDTLLEGFRGCEVLGEDLGSHTYSTVGGLLQTRMLCNMKWSKNRPMGVIFV